MYKLQIHQNKVNVSSRVDMFAVLLLTIDEPDLGGRSIVVDEEGPQQLVFLNDKSVPRPNDIGALRNGRPLDEEARSFNALGEVDDGLGQQGVVFVLTPADVAFGALRSDDIDACVERHCEVEVD